VRALLQELGRRTGVPIEPDEQTRLLDGMMAVPGVLVAGVPGGTHGGPHPPTHTLASSAWPDHAAAAGGYDAVFCLVCADAARAAVLAVWEGWTELSVSPLLARTAEVGLSLQSPPDV
jgi:phosphomevalonate kinase